jgi:CHASE2 domain-containing sensor protein
VPDRNTDARGQLKPRHDVTPIAKFAELLVLGLIVGLFSLVLAFLWKGYSYKASDLIEYLTVEIPHYFPAGHPQEPLPFRLIFVDIGESTCTEWAKDYNEVCAHLPHFPHDQLSKIFQRLVKTEPKLVVVDIDLHSEAPGSDPYDPDPNTFTDGEKTIRSTVQAMEKTPFLIAQPLIRVPKGDQKQDISYVAIFTILHKLDKPNLRFGQIEQDLDDGSVIRRFPAKIPIRNGDRILNPNSEDSGLVWHLAVRVCELVTQDGLCGRNGQRREIKSRTGSSSQSFGDEPVNPGDHVQFRYLIGRDIGQFIDLDVEQIEARAVLAEYFDARTVFKDAVVVLGSTARGRGDYHITPLDILGGQTAGVVVVANEVVAALENKRLVEPLKRTLIAEKLALILVSTAVVFALFWYPRISRRPRILKGVAAKCFSYLLLLIHFAIVVIIAVLVNFILVWVFGFYSLRHGELVDPITPVIAVILDIVVDLCSSIGHQVETWAKRWTDHRVKTVP